MDRRPSFFRRHAWALVTAALLVCAVAFTLLEAFVLPQPYTPAANLATPAASVPPAAPNSAAPDVSPPAGPLVDPAAAPTPKPPVFTDTSYEDGNISLSIETVRGSIGGRQVVYYVADVKLASVAFFKTAFAKGTFGKNITEKTSNMAVAANAIFAINGDYYGFRDTGLVIRGGVLYRDQPRSAPDNYALAVEADGALTSVLEGDVSGEALVARGVAHCFTFGPLLVENGQAVNAQSKLARLPNPRTAFGQVAPLHYLFIVADGRSDESGGLTLPELTQIFIDRGCTVAYNLDGGGSSAMWFNGKLVNSPTDGTRVGERRISDILYIGDTP